MVQDCWLKYKNFQLFQMIFFPVYRKLEKIIIDNPLKSFTTLL